MATLLEKCHNIKNNKEANLKPENLKAGVTCLGVVGTLEEGTNTSDANATAEDILLNKTAYVNGEKIEGTLVLPKITNGDDLFYNGARADQIYEILSLCDQITSAKRMFSVLPKSIVHLDCSSLDVSKVVDMTNIFNQSFYLESIDFTGWHTDSLEIIQQPFCRCNELTSLDLSGFDLSKTRNINGLFVSLDNLTNLKSPKNIGKGFNRQKEDDVNHYILLHNEKLTAESIADVLDNLYDLNLTYDVANGGTLYKQSVLLGPTNYTKVTSEQIAAAEAKGWKISEKNSV